MQANASEEMLEIWDWETGEPTGRAVSRRESHRRGIPHECVNLWIIRTERKPEILFQKRASTTDSNPDYLDITVGGHVPFGSGKGTIQKEASEEIGIKPREEDLIDIGFYRYEEITGERIHREFQHVYLLHDNRPLNEYRFIDGEVEEIYAVPLQQLEELLEGDRDILVESFNGSSREKKSINRGDFHPLIFDPSMRGYIEIIIECVKELIEKGQVTCRYETKIQLCNE